MAEENTNIYRKFVQFDGTNWNSWKFRVSVLLEEENLNRYIEEDWDDILRATIDDNDEVRCIMEEKKCKSILVQCISDSHLEYVQDKIRAKDMYDSLKAVFERKSVASQLYLRKKLITMKLEETDDMADHFLVFDKTVRELRSVGSKLEDLDVVCHLLLSLPTSYGNLVTALETLEPEKLTIEFVKGRLLDEFHKRGNSTDIAGNGSNRSVAMYSNSLKCYRCHKVGHKSFECEMKTESKKESGNFASNYGESDDEVTVAFCTIEQSKMKSKQRRKNKKCNTKRSIQFYIDSCATSHMVNSESYFTKGTGLFKKKINIAKNGMTLDTERKGDIEGTISNNNKDTNCILKDVLFVKNLRYNLLSVGKMQEAGLEINFKNRSAYISYKDKLIGVAPKRGNLYELNFIIKNEKEPRKIRTFVKKQYFNPGRNLKRDGASKEHLKDAVHIDPLVSRAQTNVKDVLSLRIRNVCNSIETHILKSEGHINNLKLGNVRLRESLGCTQGGGSNCKFKRRY